MAYKDQVELYKDSRTGLSSLTRWSVHNQIPYDNATPDVKVAFKPAPYAAPHNAFYLEFGSSMNTQRPRTGSVTLSTTNMRELAAFLIEQADLVDAKAAEKEKKE